MENFLDFIKGDIESKTTFLDSQPVNTKTNIKKFNENVDTILEKYNSYKTSVKKYLDIKSETLCVPKENRNLDELEREVNDARYVLTILNPVNTFFEKLGFDKILYKLNHYSEYNFKSLNEIIEKFVSKFEEAGIKLTKDDFSYTCYVYEYMSTFIDLRSTKSENYDALEAIFEKIYWVNPEIINHIELCFRMLSFKYEKEFNNYIQSLQKHLLAKNMLSSREDAVRKYEELYNKLKNAKKEDISDIISLCKSGTIDMTKYFEDSKTRMTTFENLVINPDLLNNPKDKEKFYDTLEKLKVNVLEYESYLNFIPLIKDFKSEYEKKLEFDAKELDKTLKTLENEIINKENKLDKINKKILGKRLPLFETSDADIKQLKLDSMVLANELYEAYKNYENEYFRIKVLTNINKFSSVKDLLNLYYSFDYFKKGAIKKVFSITEFDELNNYSDKIDEFAINPNNIIVNVIDLFRDEDVSKVISNKYRLNNINLDETSLAKDELNALVEKIDFILRIDTIENSNLDVHKLWFISEVAKIDRA